MSLLVTVKVLHIRGILYYNCYMCWVIDWSILIAFLFHLTPHVLVPSADNLCNPFEPDQAPQHLGPYLYPNYLTMKLKRDHFEKIRQTTKSMKYAWSLGIKFLHSNFLEYLCEILNSEQQFA